MSAKLFAIQIFAWLAIILLNSILVYAYFNFIIVDLLPHYMNFQIPLIAIFSTFLGIYIFINNLQIPFFDYSILTTESTDEDIELCIQIELADITYHLMQSGGLTAGLIIFMGIFV